MTRDEAMKWAGRIGGAITGVGIPLAIAAEAIGWERVTGAIDQRIGLAPSLDDEVTVEVTGQPGTTKQQLYFLALAAANGIVRRFANLTGDFLVPAMGSLTIEYDAAGHWVRCTLGYRWSMGAVNADTGTDVKVGAMFDRMAVYRGPQCAVVGGTFDFISDTLGGIPPSSVAPGAPQLPLRGDTILTSCPTVIEPSPFPITQDPPPSAPLIPARQETLSPNPKPPGDNRSRGNVIVPATGPGSVTGGQPIPGPTPTAPNAKCCDKLRALIPLVYTALTSPATNSKTTYPLSTPGPTGG